MNSDLNSVSGVIEWIVSYVTSRGESPTYCSYIKQNKRCVHILKAKLSNIFEPERITEDARLPSDTSPWEGGACLPSLQTTVEKCSANWRWNSSLSELFQGDRGVSLACWIYTDQCMHVQALCSYTTRQVDKIVDTRLAHDRKKKRTKWQVRHL